jgi:hypothetical protein
MIFVHVFGQQSFYYTPIFVTNGGTSLVMETKQQYLS